MKRLEFGLMVALAAFAVMLASCGGEVGETPAADEEAPAAQVEETEEQASLGFLSRPGSLESPAVAAGDGMILLAGIVKRADGSGIDLMAARASAEGEIEAEWRLAGMDGAKAKGKVSVLRSAAMASEFLVLLHWTGLRKVRLWRIADGSEPWGSEEIALPYDSDQGMRFPEISLLSLGGEDHLLYLAREEDAEGGRASLMLLSLGAEAAVELERFDAGDTCRIEGFEAGHLGLAVCWTVVNGKFRNANLALYTAAGERLAGPVEFYNGRRNYGVYLHQDEAGDDVLLLWGANRKYSYQRMTLAGGTLSAAYEIPPNKRFNGAISGFWREDDRFFVALVDNGTQISSARFDEGAFNARRYADLVLPEDVDSTGLSLTAFGRAQGGVALLVAHGKGYSVRLIKP